MFCGKMSDNLVVKTHCRTLRAIYDTQTLSYEELLHLSVEKKIHTQNLQILMVEVYKCLNNISPRFTWDYFKYFTSIFYFFLNLFIQACNYCFYMLVNWFLLVHTCRTYDNMYVLTNYK